MSADQESRARPDDEQQKPDIRRGQGLRLSITAPLADEAGAEAPPQAAPTPERRGQGLRLSTDRPLDEDAVGDLSAAADVAPVSIVTRQLQLPQGVVSYRQAGSGEPLLLVHGWAASSRSWLKTLAQLADMRSCYALDLPGFGESPPLAQPPSIVAMAEVTLAFADALGLERFDLNGHSFGAAVAAYLAARWPGRVRRLVLTAFGVRRIAPERIALGLTQGPVNLALSLWQPWLKLWQPWTNTLATTPPMAQFLAGWFLDRVSDDTAELQASVRDLVGADPRTHLACFASVSDPALIAALGAVSVPALLVAGQGDRLIPLADVKAATGLLHDCRLIVLEPCGHMPMIEQPEAYHQGVRAFLLDG